MKKTDVLIIGAGAAGLMAAYKLVKVGKTVTVLEARNHTGGRIHTLNNQLFFQHAEQGAEFVHGNLPVTLNLLKEAGIPYHSANAAMWRYHNGQFEENMQFIEEWDELLARLEELQHDIPINEFMEQAFPGDKYARLRSNIWDFVSGYDTADPRDASTFALRNEWKNEDMEAQHRIAGGYCTMIKYLADTCKAAGNAIVLNAIVNKIQLLPNGIKVFTTDEVAYEADKVIVAVPLGVLKAAGGEQGAIVFDPPIPDYSKAMQQLGFGAIIKVLLEFDEAFWESETVTAMVGTSLKNMGYLFSKEAIPTWWTQIPQRSTLLTGWLGGPAAFDKKDASAEDILKLALTSLANIFKIDADTLKDKLIAWYVANWTADPLTRGSYSYDTIHSSEARKIMNSPVENKLFFAGEYLYDGAAIGTVEAALSSGSGVAGCVL
ncbi:NAD(P)/FAD-dependent oxidoreductase [Mucilaginibacter gynuensis]|uniref:Tryptophan 2-monooxygenase n=1 Tax=Mucilaginibacter gynuensis TaxID=1302236 RepID=A0ABP8HKN7_9SPHI